MLAAVLFRPRVIPFSIALVTFVVFSPALWNGFVEWDDTVNLLNNPDYRGLGWTQLQWMFTAVLMGVWAPLTWMTFGLDYLVWGMNPFGYHLTSLLLHAANAGVFYLVALRLLRLATTGVGATALRLGAAMAALFFSLHPLRAESVAWATERRDVLSGLFFLLAILTYLKVCAAEGSSRRRWLAGSVGCYVLALASKPIVMTLPFVLILMDIYPLRRLGRSWREWTAPASRRVWVEKLPYLVLGLVGAGVGLYGQVANSFLTPLDHLPVLSRLSLAVWSVWFYLWKTLLPFGLSPLYELPARVNPLEPGLVGSAVAVGVITGGLILMRRRWPAGLAVWVYYGMVLAPVSGIVHAGFQLTHDRYSYLSCLGWGLLVGAGVCAAVRASASGALRSSLARLAVGAMVVWFLGLATLTWQQVQVWRDTDTLWRYALEFNPECAICRSNLGVVLYNQGHPELAIEHLERALALRPDRVRSHHTLGLALASLGRLPEAIGHFRQLLEHHPRDVDVRNNLAVALIQQGEHREAIEQLRQAMALDPAHFQVHSNLGLAMSELGNPGAAIEHYLRAIELESETAIPHLGLARAYLALGQIAAAQEEYRVLKRLDPRLAAQLSPLMDDSGSDTPAAPEPRPLSAESRAPRPS
ncbi:MAG: tetratricopeptide repeat protein [Candidatus Methylomirabilia bacterium]